MSKPKKNDPCPCGSGKKYKKCCGANNIVEFNPNLYNNRLDQLSEDLLNFAITYFESDLIDFSEEYLLPVDEMDDEELNTYFPLLSAWFILKHPLENGQTIFQHFHAKQQNKIKYPSVKRAFSSWSNGQPGIFKVIDMERSASFKMTLHDIVTEQTYYVFNQEDPGAEIGDLVLGLLIPYVNSHQFLFGMIFYSDSYEEHIHVLLSELGVTDHELQNVYPELLGLLLTSDETDDFQWLDKEHERTSQVFISHMTEKEMNHEMIKMGVYFWHAYCERYFPSVRNSGSYAAALDYLIQTHLIDDSSVTQGQLAKEYGISPGTVSTNYRRLIEGMAEINEFFQ